MFVAKNRSSCSHVLAMIFLRHPWVFCGLCVVFICGFAWLSCRGELLPTFPQHQHLFSSHGKVQEIPDGSLDILSRLLHNNPLKLVMFYAPWCGQSRKAVPEFRRAASLLHEKVTFIAINCWTGSCRKEYRLDVFPKLFAYHTKYPGLQYPDAYGYHSIHMLRFLQSVFRPFVYPGRERDLLHLLSTEQEVVISYFEPYQLEGKRYSLFFAVALSHVAKVSKPAFAVLTNKHVASTIGLNTTGEVVYHRQFSPLEAYHPNQNTTASNISAWVAGHRKQFVTQLTPNATSRDQMALQLSEKAALILFLPTRRRKIAAPLLKMFTRAALEYHNCTCNKMHSAFAVRKDEKVNHSSNEDSKSQDIKPSRTLLKPVLRTASLPAPANSVCWSLMVEHDHHDKMRNVCDICHRCRHGCNGNLDNMFDVIQPKLLHSNGLVPRPCSTILTSYNPRSLVTSVCCSSLAKGKVNDKSTNFQHYEKKLNYLIDSIYDNILALKGAGPTKTQFNLDSIKAMLSEETQKIADLAGQVDKPQTTPLPSVQSLGSSSSNDTMVTDATDGCNRTGHVTQFFGASCYSNRSVNFFYMDSDMYGAVADRLGVHWMPGSSHVALVIVDIKNEAQYILSEEKPLTNETLVDFVMGFMTSKLERRLRSSSPREAQCPPGRACVMEVTTATFEEMVINNNKDVLMVFYAPWCGMCINLSPILLAVARFFKDIHQVRIARIDGDANDLPWNLTVSSYPTIILFPAGRKASSVRFPDNEERTATRLIEFVDEHGSEAVRNALYGNTDSQCEYDVIRAKLVQLESRLLRVEQEKKLLETRLEAAIMEKVLAEYQNARALKGAKDTEQRLSKEHDARVTAERLYQQSEKNRATSDEKRFDTALQNAQLEQQLKQRTTEAKDKEQSLEKLVKKTKKFLEEKQELSSLIDDVTSKLKTLRSLTSYHQKRELFLSEKIRRLEKISNIFIQRDLDYIKKNSKTEKEITELEQEKQIMTKLLLDAEATVSGLQASLSSTNQMLGDVTKERNRAVETSKDVKKQLDEMKHKYEHLNELLNDLDIPKKVNLQGD